MWVDTGEVKLYYECPGQGQQVMVLLHGTTGRSDTFQPIVSDLSATFQLVIPDLRGHGRSDHLPGSYRVLNFAQDIIRLLDSLSTTRFLLLGHSLGGLIGIALAAERPDMIDALIIEDAPLWLRRHSVEDGSPRAYDFFKSLHELLLITRDENGLREQLPAALALREDDSLPSRLSQMDPNVLKVSFDNSLMDGFDIDQALRIITCPTLILQAGNQDEASLGDPDVQAASNALRQSTHYTIEHAGHHIHADQPTRMTTIAKEWLSTHIPA